MTQYHHRYIKQSLTFDGRFDSDIMMALSAIFDYNTFTGGRRLSLLLSVASKHCWNSQYDELIFISIESAKTKNNICYLSYVIVLFLALKTR